MPTPRKYTDDEFLAALQKHGSQRATARALGVAQSGVNRRAKLLEMRGYAPQFDMTRPVPEMFDAKGVSTYYNKHGKPTGQWVKAELNAKRAREAMVQFIDTLKEEVRGLAKPVPKPKPNRHAAARSLSAYIIGDAHFGMYAWAAEAGEDFDTAIASADLRAAIDLLVAGAPPSKRAFLVDVGDFLHTDDRSNATPASGHPLDVDTRIQRVRRIAVDALRYCVNRMLEKHDVVELFQAPGNHNPESAGWMAAVLEAYFENEPRVRVETSPAYYYYARHGRCLIGITHGDKAKMPDLPGIMAVDRAKDWGDTEYRYWWTGHIHHTRHQEYRGAFVESFNTLAASDAWHHSSGYRSARQMQRIDLDSEYGIYNRGIASLRRIRGKA
ncbi:winged helix-turn-helix domain-containing protein [Flavobacterium sp.]|uniref:winged helix-turn-helix domain-containing protein n=1 Tax=Flavobacterium sp. TaxID=239 RepID=UPI0037C117DB